MERVVSRDLPARGASHQTPGGGRADAYSPQSQLAFLSQQSSAARCEPGQLLPLQTIAKYAWGATTITVALALADARPRASAATAVLVSTPAGPTALNTRPFNSDVDGSFYRSIGSIQVGLRVLK